MSYHRNVTGDNPIDNPTECSNRGVCNCGECTCNKAVSFLSFSLIHLVDPHYCKWHSSVQLCYHVGLINVFWFQGSHNVQDQINFICNRDMLLLMATQLILISTHPTWLLKGGKGERGWPSKHISHYSMYPFQAYHSHCVRWLIFNRTSCMCAHNIC